MDGAGHNYSEWNKPDTEIYTLIFCFIDIIFETSTVFAPFGMHTKSGSAHGLCWRVKRRGNKPTGIKDSERTVK